MGWSVGPGGGGHLYARMSDVYFLHRSKRPTIVGGPSKTREGNSHSFPSTRLLLCQYQKISKYRNLREKQSLGVGLGD